MFLERVYNEWRKIVYAAIALLALMLVLLYACRTRTGPTRGSNTTPNINSNPANSPKSEREAFQGVDVAPKQILIKLNGCDGVDSKKLTEAVRKLTEELTSDHRVTASRGAIGCWFLIKSSTLTVQQLLELFDRVIATKRNLRVDQLNAVVVHAEPNFLLHVDASPDDYLFTRNKLWGLKNHDHPGIDIHAEEAWSISTGSRSIAVGVIDSGIFADHPDLLSNVWSAPDEFDVTLGDEVIHCPKGSHGYNAVAAPSEVCNPLDEPVNSGHGTHVSGIVGAVGNNSEGVVGVNWKTTIIPLKAVNELDEAPVDDVIKAIRFAVEVRRRFPVEANTRVLNASFGYLASNDPRLVSTNLREAIEFAGSNEILFVASAGNNGKDNDETPHYPSTFDLPNLLSVTAIDETGALSEFANHGKSSVHLAAPGTGIYSTYPFDPTRPVELTDMYQTKSGTSQAAPFVSGAAALMLTVPACSQLHPSELKTLIMRGTDPTTDPITPNTATATRGYLDVAKSIGLCGTPGP